MPPTVFGNVYVVRTGQLNEMITIFNDRTEAGHFARLIGDSTLTEHPVFDGDLLKYTEAIVAHLRRPS